MGKLEILETEDRRPYYSTIPIMVTKVRMPDGHITWVHDPREPEYAGCGQIAACAKVRHLWEAQQDEENKVDMDLAGEIRAAINRASRKGKSDTPDFVLAEYLMLCLAAYEEAVTRRDQLKLYGGADMEVKG